MRGQFKRYCADKKGVAAIEAAIIFPILITCLFIVFGLGSYLLGTHDAQRIVEQTARQARVLSEPTKEDLVLLLKDNVKTPPFGTYTPEVILVSQFGGSYAKLNLEYDFSYDFPFLGNLGITSTAVTEVKLRKMPI